MSENQFFELVREILISKNIQFGLDTQLADTGWDSLSNIELVALLDEKFNLKLDSDKLADCDSFADIFALVR